MSDDVKLAIKTFFIVYLISLVISFAFVLPEKYSFVSYMDYVDFVKLKKRADNICKNNNSLDKIKFVSRVKTIFVCKNNMIFNDIKNK